MKALRAIDKRDVGRLLHNRAENSHQPFRRRKRAMLRFRQMRSLQKFAALHASIHSSFYQERHFISRQNFGPQTFGSKINAPLLSLPGASILCGLIHAGAGRFPKFSCFV